ncbi:unnamed protein product [Brachionus calyciflorus]|uniref:MYND-type domain-containing protein n=1 Tax=Brachionus calyciflorus TaxID=104777 RepID=A0A813SVQ1_9BILA|nr:unnamed protein product [Brachionus calyciflorus]
MKNLKSCSCGYKPEGDLSDKYFHCLETKALRNHVTFPSFHFLSDVDNQSEVYFKLIEDNIIPKRHWAFLVEIDERMENEEHGFMGWSRFNENLPIPESNDKPNSFQWSDLTKGQTMAILYAEKKMIKRQMSICEETLDNCFVFKVNMEQLENEAVKVLDFKDSQCQNKNLSCFNCGVELKEERLECEKCKLAVYCSKKCQDKSWSMVHEKLCSQSDVLLRLACLPRHSQFEDFYTFFSNSFDFLPQYIFSEKYVQKF